ncbi:hypothetical protein HK096_001826, partial [Nowakowskiella sp. JEL0078]
MFDYTRCKVDAPTNGTYQSPSGASSYTLSQLHSDLTSAILKLGALDITVQQKSKILSWSYNTTTKICSMRLSIQSTLPKPVNMYIRLTNFRQNDRIYTSSFSTQQLRGDFLSSVKDIESDCSLLKFANCDTASAFKFSNQQYSMDCWPPTESRDRVIQNAEPEAQYYPCGLIANSMFSDDLSELRCLGSLTLSDFEVAQLVDLDTLVSLNHGVMIPWPQNGPNYVNLFKSVVNNLTKPVASTKECSPYVDLYAFDETDLVWSTKKSKYGMTAWNSTDERRAQIPKMLIPPPVWRRTWPLWKDGYNSSNIPDLSKWERFH